MVKTNKISIPKFFYGLVDFDLRYVAPEDRHLKHPQIPKETRIPAESSLLYLLFTKGTGNDEVLWSNFMLIVMIAMCLPVRGVFKDENGKPLSFKEILLLKNCLFHAICVWIQN